jgi:hypothetical protein
MHTDRMNDATIRRRSGSRRKERAPAQPAAQPSRPEPQDIAPAPAPATAPEPRRVCSFCMTRQPLAGLAYSADSLVCTDTAACTDRAAASGLYAQDENELELAAREAHQGALT